MLSFIKLVVFMTVCILVKARFTVRNNLGYEVWIGIQGNPNKPHLNNGGFILGPKQSNVVNSPPDWAGRFWARTFCNKQNNHCLTGDCGNKLQCAGAGGTPPVSLAEITMKGSGGKDYYDISLVDGFNVPISIEPVNGQGDGGQYSCKKAGCYKDLNSNCPDDLKLKNEKGEVIACKSACAAFNTDEYCCRGAHGTPETCKSSDWPHNYPKYFKDACPDAYSYAYDDHKSTFTCKAEDYIITIGG